MAEVADITRTVPPRTEMRTTIQWGNIIKGVAIVAAVAVVGVVAFQAVVPLIETTPWLSQTIGFVGQGLVLAGEGLWTLAQGIAGGVWHLIGGMFPASMQGAAAGGIISTTAGNSINVAQIGGWVVGGGAALATALFLRAPQHLWHALTNLVGQERVAVGGRTEVIHQGHTVQDHNRPAITQAPTPPALPVPTTETVTQTGSPSQSSSQSSSSWADRAPKREASHGAQIDAEQALSSLSTQSRSA